MTHELLLARGPHAHAAAAVGGGAGGGGRRQRRGGEAVYAAAGCPGRERSWGRGATDDGGEGSDAAATSGRNCGTRGGSEEAPAARAGTDETSSGPGAATDTDARTGGEGGLVLNTKVNVHSMGERSSRVSRYRCDYNR